MKKGRITMKSSSTMAEVFSDFMLHCKAKGLSEKTLATYSQHFSAISKHLDSSAFIEDIIKSDLEMMVASMRDAGLSSNSIRSYTRTLKSFLTWCNEENITRLNIPLYKAEETVKETYSDEELRLLLQ